MIVTVTATRKGLTHAQLEEAEFLLSSWGTTELVHGAAQGGDTELHRLAHKLGIPCLIYPASGVPSNIDRILIKSDDLRYPAVPPLDRNKTMVNRSTRLLGFPKGYNEELRSGTWAAIRYARKQKKNVWIVWPDGSVQEELQ